MKLININFNKSDKIIFVSIFCISFLLFLFYVSLNADENYYDEQGYLYRSQTIVDNGLFGFKDTLRTYLYPSILASLKFISNDNLVTKIILSVIQYAVYLVTVIFIANYAFSFLKSKRKLSFPNFIDPKKGEQHYLDRYNDEPAYKSWFDKNYPNYTIKQATEIVITVKKNEHKILWHSVIAFGFLNPFLIQATTLFLPDIFASCFVVLSIFCLARMDLTRSKLIFLALGLFYASIMIRPSSIIFIPIVVGLILFRFLKKKHISIYKISIISIILLVIFIPQIYQNVTNFDKWTPLLAEPLYEKQLSWAATHLKYSTVVISGEEPGLIYETPFAVEEDVNFFQLFFKDPFNFLVVYSSHIFGVFDWDYVESYIKDFYPLNRIPTSLLIYSTWFFVIWGIIQARLTFTTNGFLMKILIISTIIYLAFIATTAVETRFGYPIFLLLLPFSGYGVKHLYDFCIKHDNKTSKLWFKRIGLIAIYSIFISTFFYISFLFSAQTGRIDWFGFFNL